MDFSVNQPLGEGLQSVIYQGQLASQEQANEVNVPSPMSWVVAVLSLVAIVIFWSLPAIKDQKILRIMLIAVIAVMGLAILNSLVLHIRKNSPTFLIFVRIPLYALVMASAIGMLIEGKQVADTKGGVKTLYSVARFVPYIILWPLILLVLGIFGLFIDDRAGAAIFVFMLGYWRYVLPMNV